MTNKSNEDPWFAELKRYLDEHFSVMTATHKRRVALKHGVRESYELEADCLHTDFDFVKFWCNDCGITAVELIGRNEL